MKPGVFGVWDAPATDELDPIEPPVGEKCMYCREEIGPEDNGAVMPNLMVQHRECGLRGVFGGIGHHVDHERYCRGEEGPDGGLSYRQSALMVWQFFVHGQQFTVEDIENTKRGEEAPDG